MRVSINDQDWDLDLGCEEQKEFVIGSINKKRSEEKNCCWELSKVWNLSIFFQRSRG